MTRKGMDLWPEDLDLSPIETPSILLLHLAKTLTERTGGRVTASVNSLNVAAEAPFPFAFSFYISSGGSTFSPSYYHVLSLGHGVDPYPVTLLPEEKRILSEKAFISFLRRKLQSPEVLAAIRFFATYSAPATDYPDLWPEALDLSGIASPVGLVAKQAAKIREHTNGRIIGEVSEHYQNQPESCTFCFSLDLKDESPMFTMHQLRYRLFTVSHGLDMYPVVVQPGDLVFKSEADFTEFVRQELASENVRKALAILLGKSLLG